MAYRHWPEESAKRSFQELLADRQLQAARKVARERRFTFTMIYELLREEEDWIKLEWVSTLVDIVELPEERAR